MYLASPDYMGQYARRLMDAGARFLGGCCGTMPEHIQSIRGAVAGRQAPLPDPVTIGSTQETEPGPGEGGTVSPPRGGRPRGPRLGANAGCAPTPLAERSRWGEKLSTGGFATSVEIVPPRGWDPAPLLQAAEKIREAGGDAVSVVDSTWGRHRMGAIPAGALIQDRVGIETLVHYPCRNREMMGMISDLLGAAAGGVRNVLLVSGELMPSGPYPDPGAGLDIDSIGLTNVVHYLNRGLDPGGGAVEPPTRFVIGVALNQGARDLDGEVRRFGWKVEAGAEFAVTQPLFEPDPLHRFLDRTEDWRIPVVLGLWPLTSLRNAEFLANEVPGINVPDQVLERMKAAQDRSEEAAEEEGVRIAAEALKVVRNRVAGVHVGAPQGRVDLALRVLEHV